MFFSWLNNSSMLQVWTVTWVGHSSLSAGRRKCPYFSRRVPLFSTQWLFITHDLWTYTYYRCRTDADDKDFSRRNWLHKNTLTLQCQVVLRGTSSTGIGRCLIAILVSFCLILFCCLILFHLIVILVLFFSFVPFPCLILLFCSVFGFV